MRKKILDMTLPSPSQACYIQGLIPPPEMENESQKTVAVEARKEADRTASAREMRVLVWVQCRKISFIFVLRFFFFRK